VQAHHSPARLPGPQSYPQFVAQAQLPHDSRMPVAEVPVAVGGLIQCPDRILANGQVGEPVDITPSQLVGQEGGRRLEQRFLTNSRGEQQGGRVHRGDERGIDPGQRLQPGGDLAAERDGVQTAVAALDERFYPSLVDLRRHDLTVQSGQARDHPRKLAWCPLHARYRLRA
jgi:hypothetical protein